MRSVYLLLATVTAIFVALSPPQLLLQSSYWTDNRRIGGDGNLCFVDDATVNTEWEKEGLAVWNRTLFPLVILPQVNESLWNCQKLLEWTKANPSWIGKQLYKHGAILFRHFEIKSSDEFESLSKALAPDLQQDFLRSTPRSKFNGSSVVFTASDDPPWVVIPAHCERCWIDNPPKMIMFFAQEPNQGAGGETPLIDFRQVWTDMNVEVKNRLLAKGIKYIRHFYDKTDEIFIDRIRRMSWPIPTAWQDMFGGSDDPELVALKAKELKFDVTWLSGTAGKGILEATSIMPAICNHPVTGDEVWHNHLALLHVSSHEQEYAFTAQHLNSWKYWFLHYWTRFELFTHWILFGDDFIGQTALYGDGTLIDTETINHIRHLIWNNTNIHSHQPGDVVLVDNYRLAHARQPFSGHRRILTTWA